MTHTLEECVQYIASRNILQLAEDIIKVDGVGKALELAMLTKALHTVYNETGEALIPDEKYDILYELNQIVNGITLVSHKSESIRKYPHKYTSLRGTVEKIHFVLESEKGTKEKRKSYQKWIENIEKSIGRTLDGVPIRASLKVDGVSAIIEAENGESKRVLKRGDTENNEAENIPLLENRFFPDIENVKECGLKTEIYMTYKAFEDFKKIYGDFNSPRSAVTSIINSDEIIDKKLSYLTIYDIEMIQDGETVMPDNLYFELPSAKDYDALQVIITELKGISVKRGIPADGVVIRIMDEDIQDTLGRDGAINKYEVGYKFPAERHVAYLKKVNFSMGKQGSYTPVAEIEPIKVNGNTITNISLGSVPRFVELDLRVGQPVYITYDVIPYLYDCSQEEKEAYPEPVGFIVDCSQCDEALLFEESKLFCANYECPGNIRGRLLTWVTKVGIEGISEAIIDDLCRELGIETRAELYRVKYRSQVLESLPRYGESSVKNIVDAIEAKRELPFDVVIGALGINNIGRSKMKTILTHFTKPEFYLMLTSLDFSPIVKIKGIGEKDKENLTAWFSDERNMDEFNGLVNEIKMLEPTRSIDSHTILFTKVRDYDFQAYLESKGYAIADKYKKDVDVVIAGEESKKTEKARKDGKLVLTLEQAHDIYKYN